MAVKLSAPLREFFISEIEEDANATLDLARSHLIDFYDNAPDDPTVSSSVNLLTETEELLQKYDPHKPLSEMVGNP